MIYSSQDCIKVLDQNGNLVFMNHGGQLSTECDFDLIVGACWLDFWEGETKTQALAAFEKAKQGGLGEFYTFGPTLKTKIPKWWFTTLTLIKEKNSDSQCILAVSRDVSRLKSLELSLREALQSSDELIAVCGHELKSPLTSLCLQIEATKVALQQDSQNMVNTSEILATVSGYEKQVNRLIDLVQGIFDSTNVNSGKLKLTYQRVNLSELVYEVIYRFSVQLKQAKCIAIVNIPRNIQGDWDPFRLEQVLINLLENAVKYGAGKPITIETIKFEKKIVLSVQDNGVGIAANNFDRIFQRYERAHGDSLPNGLGLGLYIVKQIIEAHEGSISVESTPAVGSKFLIELPIGRPNPI